MLPASSLEGLAMQLSRWCIGQREQCAQEDSSSLAPCRCRDPYAIMLTSCRQQAASDVVNQRAEARQMKQELILIDMRLERQWMKGAYDAADGIEEG